MSSIKKAESQEVPTGAAPSEELVRLKAENEKLREENEQLALENKDLQAEIEELKIPQKESSSQPDSEGVDTPGPDNAEDDLLS